MYGVLYQSTARTKAWAAEPTMANLRDSFIHTVLPYVGPGEKASSLGEPSKTPSQPSGLPGGQYVGFTYSAGPREQGGAVGPKDNVIGFTDSMDELTEAMRQARPVNMVQLQNFFSNAMNLDQLLQGKAPTVDLRSDWHNAPNPFTTFARDLQAVPYDYNTGKVADPTLIGPFFGRMKKGFKAHGYSEQAEALTGAAKAYWDHIEKPYREAQGLDTPSAAASVIAVVTGEPALPDTYEDVRRTPGEWLTRPGQKFYKKPVFWIGTSAGVLLTILLLRRR